jgi:hypothetical protein
MDGAQGIGVGQGRAILGGLKTIAQAWSVLAVPRDARNRAKEADQITAHAIQI